MANGKADEEEEERRTTTKTTNKNYEREFLYC